MNTNERQALTAAIIAERRRQGMTQSDLADAAGVSRKTIGNIESGRSLGQVAVLERLAKVLGIVPADADYDQSTKQLLAVIGPLIQRIPEERRAAPVSRCVTILADAAQAPAQQRPIRLLSDDIDPAILDLPHAADTDQEGDDPGEDDH